MTSLRFPALIFAVVSLAPLSAMAQRCVGTTLTDTVCDCGCGTIDPACPAGTFKVCAVSHCLAGEVPWEHTPSQCMSSACGDGWNDPDAGEACDDGNALASGGCSADCRAVSPGYVCGAGAQGCRLGAADGGTSGDAGVTLDAGTPDAGSGLDARQGTDAGTGAAVDAGPDVSPPPATGCSTAPGGTLSLLAVALAGLAGRRSRARREPAHDR